MMRKAGMADERKPGVTVAEDAAAPKVFAASKAAVHKGEPVISVRDLGVEYVTGHGAVRAVDGVSFDVRAGECFALVGESGCGKSTTAAAIMQLVRKPGRVAGGQVLMHGQDLLAYSEDQMADVRGSRIGMIFQNPLDSLNPVYTIGDQVAESLMVDGMSREQALKEAEQALTEVRIPNVRKRMRQYPHEMSGGMRQRVMIAMMLCRKPELLICDEPTTALDVTTQAGVLALIDRLREELGTAVLLITHDFGVVAETADRVGVMYAGRLVEMGSVRQIFEKPLHPYTQLLMRALPAKTRFEGRLETINGMVPDLTDLPSGCGFANRCPRACERCRSWRYDLHEIEEGHFVACGEVTAHE